MVSKKIKIIKNEQQEDRYVLGVVYAPDEVDAHGDTMEAEDIEKAAWSYLENINSRGILIKQASNILEAITNNKECSIDITELANEIAKQKTPISLGHTYFSDDFGEVVESYIVRSDQQIGDELIKKGSWMLGMVLEENMYELVKSGDIVGFSLEGTGYIVPIEE